MIETCETKFINELKNVFAGIVIRNDAYLKKEYAVNAIANINNRIQDLLTYINKRDKNLPEIIGRVLSIIWQLSGSDLTLKIGDGRKQISQLIVELCSAISAFIIDWHKRMVSLLDEKDKTIAKQEQEISALTAQLKQVNKTIAEQTKTVAPTDDPLQENNHRLTELKLLLQKLQTELEATQNTIKEKNLRISELESCQASGGKEFMTAKEEIAGLKAGLAALQKSSEDKAVELSKLISAEKSLNEELNAVNSENERLERQVNDFGIIHRINDQNFVEVIRLRENINVFNEFFLHISEIGKVDFGKMSVGQLRRHLGFLKDALQSLGINLEYSSTRRQPRLIPAPSQNPEACSPFKFQRDNDDDDNQSAGVRISEVSSELPDEELSPRQVSAATSAPILYATAAQAIPEARFSPGVSSSSARILTSFFASPAHASSSSSAMQLDNAVAAENPVPSARKSAPATPRTFRYKHTNDGEDTVVDTRRRGARTQDVHENACDDAQDTNDRRTRLRR